MEIIPKETPKIPPWLDILFYFAIGFLVLVFIASFVINQPLKSSQETLEDLESTLAKEVSERASLKNEILTYQKKINDFSFLIDNHRNVSKIFAFMENQCHPKVWFSGFSLNAEERMVTLTGEAQDFESLGQQMLILRDEKMIKSVGLLNISMKKEGKITFNLSISFDPLIFK